MARKTAAILFILLVSMSVVLLGTDSGDEQITGHIIRLPFLRGIIKVSDTPVTTAEEAAHPTVKAKSLNNDKFTSKYTSQAFIVSDKEWRDVLGLVPVAMWMKGSTLNKYPVLFYHEEDSGFDMDSTIFFLEQYHPKDIILVGDTPEELDNHLMAMGYDPRIEFSTVPPTATATVGRAIGINLDRGIEDTATPQLLDTGADEIIRTDSLDKGIEDTTTPPLLDTSADEIIRIDPEDYHKYWENFYDVVVCQDDYQHGLLASMYAAYINAPLLFDGHTSHINLVGKNIITVGSTGFSGSEHYTLEQLERKLLEMYPTDKIMLANPHDIYSYVGPIEERRFRPKITRDDMYKLYEKTSLSAPFLAVGKNELLLTTPLIEADAVDSFLETKITNLRINPKYLTIMASPRVIEMDIQDEAFVHQVRYKEADNHIYGDLDGDGFQDISVGRIFSLTPTDVSAYVARDLFLDNIRKSNNFAMLWPKEFDGPYYGGKSMDKSMRYAGFSDTSVYQEPPSFPIVKASTALEDRFFAVYADHGQIEGWGGGTSTLRSASAKLSPMIIVSDACLTCAFKSALDNPISHPERTFCTNVIRHGAKAHIGAVTEATATELDMGGLISRRLLQGDNIGQAFLYFRRANEYLNRIIPKRYRGFREIEPYDKYFVLVGDPTLKLNSPSAFLEEAALSVVADGNTRTAKLRVNQDSTLIHYEHDCVGGSSSCSRGVKDFYMPPSSKYIASSRKVVEDYSNPSAPSEFSEILFFEMEGSYTVSRAETFKIKYSDGTEESYALENDGGLFKYGDDPSTFVYVLPLKVKGKNLVLVQFKKEGLDMTKVLPSYEYEIEFITSIRGVAS